MLNNDKYRIIYHLMRMEYYIVHENVFSIIDPEEACIDSYYKTSWKIHTCRHDLLSTTTGLFHFVDKNVNADIQND